MAIYIVNISLVTSSYSSLSYFSTTTNICSFEQCNLSTNGKIVEPSNGWSSSVGVWAGLDLPALALWTPSMPMLSFITSGGFKCADLIITTHHWGCPGVHPVVVWLCSLVCFWPVSRQSLKLTGQTAGSQQLRTDPASHGVSLHHACGQTQPDPSQSGLQPWDQPQPTGHR